MAEQLSDPNKGIKLIKFGSRTPADKMKFIGKLIIFLVTLGFAFPHVFED